MLLVHQTLAGINCSMCKDDLLDSLSVTLLSSKGEFGEPHHEMHGIKY